MDIHDLHEVREALREMEAILSDVLHIVDKAVDAEQKRMLSNGKARMVNGYIVYLADDGQLARGKAEEEGR